MHRPLTISARDINLRNLPMSGAVEVIGVNMMDTAQLEAMKDSGTLMSLANYITSTNPEGQVC